ncbi:hypothetical protein ACWKSP_22105 [Micromonosporaceae bacterium Da 78-11]
MTWKVIDGRFECVSIVVDGAAEPLLTTTLRSIPLGDFMAADRAALAPPVEATGGMRESAANRLRLAAEIYQAAVRDKKPPTKAVAAHFGISSGGASNLVARARAAGLLPPTSPGKAAG